MSFENRSTDDLVKIAETGGGLRLTAAGRSTDDLIRIATAAGEWGTLVTFCGLEERSTDELIRIAEAGEGSVVLEG